MHKDTRKWFITSPPHGKDPNTMDFSGTGQRFFGIDLKKRVLKSKSKISLLKVPDSGCINVSKY